MNKHTTVAINGFGRIGRAFLKVSLANSALNVVAVNDLGDIKDMAYLLKYDTAYGVSTFDVQVKQPTSGAAGSVVWPSLVISGYVFDTQGEKVAVNKEVIFVSEKDPTKLPWKSLNVDVVVESTGLFTSSEKAMAHITAGAKRVVVSAPIKDEPTSTVKGATLLMGMDEAAVVAGFKSCPISSNASCTTNAGSPLLAILDEAIGVEKAVLNTVHGYTASQGIVDGPNKKDFREGRAAAQNIVPSSTGAAIAVTKVLKGLSGLFDGISIRVPVVAGSIVDITFISKRGTTAEEVNIILKRAAALPRWKGIFTVTEEPLVSHDIVGNPHASIADLAMTRVVGGNLVKVLGWYDNEMGYTHTLVRHVIEAGKLI
ncbi:MAG: glyceraldehyde 3-phosphate dehydrogenase, glyceraldehyde 3-phosphate dehydrogenase [Candidatus Parcubacteria bacterium]